LLRPGRQQASPGRLGHKSSGWFAAVTRTSPSEAKPEEQTGRPKVATGLAPLSGVAHPFCLPVSFAFYRRKAWVVFSLAALLWVRRNVGWRSCTGGRSEGRDGRIGDSKAKGRQRRRQASEDTDKAKRLWCHLWIHKE